MSTLFRNEAIEGRKNKLMGEVLLTHSTPLSVFVAFAITLTITIFGFIYIGEYTRKERSTGQIRFTHGATKIYSSMPGRIRKKMVEEGQTVKQGEVLYMISLDRVTTMGHTQNVIGEQMRRKKTFLLEQVKAQSAILAENERATNRKIADLETQISSVQKEIFLQNERLLLSKSNEARFRKLFEDNFVSLSQLNDKKKEYLDQEGGLATLQRTESNLRSEINAAKSVLKTSPLNLTAQLAGLKRDLADLDQQEVSNEAQREIAVVATQDGIATVVIGEVGQTVSIDDPLLNIAPKDEEFEGNLYVSSKAIGFLQIGQNVQLRFDSFPYEKFGQYRGKIKVISETAMSPSELQLLGMPPEVLYRVKVELEKQKVMAYGRQYRLHEGMRIEADILLDSRKLYEWVLEPLYSVAGKL